MKAGEQAPGRKMHAALRCGWSDWVAACDPDGILRRATMAELEDVPTEKRCRRPACAAAWKAEDL